MANKILSSAVFSGPKFSYFDCSHPNQLSMKFGDCVPIYWDFLNPNDKATFDMSQVVRLSPMLQPILSQIDITVDAFAVRLRSLGMAERDPWQYEDFFNANKNLDGSYMLPRATGLDIGSAVNFRLGSLYDYLGYPTLDSLRRDFRRFVASKPYLLTPSLGWFCDTTEDEAVIGALGVDYQFVPLLGSKPGVDAGGYNPSDQLYALYKYNNETFAGGILGTPIAIPPLSVFALCYAIGGDVYENIDSLFNDINTAWCFDYIDIPLDMQSLVETLRTVTLPQYIYDTFKVDWQSITELWFDYVFGKCVINAQTLSQITPSLVFGNDTFKGVVLVDIFTDNVGTVSTSPYSADFGVTPDYSSFVPVVDGQGNEYAQPTGLIYSPLYPALSYWKVISDWYLNTGLFNPEDWFLQKAFIDGDKTKGYNLPALFGNPFKRNWSPDYFTSCFDSAQRGLAVGIPADGTIPDLRNANALQKFKERLLFAGHKFRDVIYSIFGIKMSSAIADMSEVLGRWVNPVNVDTTLQTSASSADSPLASYAGTGLSFGHKKNILHYVAEEPTVIMFIASIRPKYATYYQGFPKKLRRNYLMDYAIPGFSNIGEQMVSNRELYCDLGAGDSEVFGFTRRFADFMSAPGECHGDFKDSLDSWHLARQFDGSPLLNQQFLQVDPVADNLNRVFATTSDALDKFYCNFFISGGIVRSIPKRIYYDL